MNVIQKVYALMGWKLPKPSEQKLASIKIIGTAWEPVKDAEIAFKEANGARFALAKYKQIKQAFDDNDLEHRRHVAKQCQRRRRQYWCGPVESDVA